MLVSWCLPMFCWGWICYHSWWTGKKIGRNFDHRRRVFRRPRGKNAFPFTKSHHIWIPIGWAVCPSLGVLLLQPACICLSERAAAQKGRWLHLSGNCYFSWQSSLWTSAKSDFTWAKCWMSPVQCLTFLQKSSPELFLLDPTYTLECDQSVTLFYTIYKYNKFKLMLVAAGVSYVVTAERLSRGLNQ